NLATPAVVTADFGYLRLRREDYTAANLKRWAKFGKAQASRWSDVFVYFKHEETGSGPVFAKQMLGFFPGTCAELMDDPGGAFEGPADLSVNPKYLEGFGK
ncbi:MAG TPA: DUF72 domain-containing protein, partial [Verrucomicrobiales bacterium]|nr:DUF72 domain-containing protein [Verrucomicrobiales bacterium]